MIVSRSGLKGQSIVLSHATTIEASEASSLDDGDEAQDQNESSDYLDLLFVGRRAPKFKANIILWADRVCDRSRRDKRASARNTPGPGLFRLS
jgi:hypothetical protein